MILFGTWHEYTHVLCYPVTIFSFAQNYEIQDDNYYNLPQVRATTNKCQPCNRQFGRLVLYRYYKVQRFVN